MTKYIQLVMYSEELQHSVQVMYSEELQHSVQVMYSEELQHSCKLCIVRNCNIRAGYE